MTTPKEIKTTKTTNTYNIIHEVGVEKVKQYGKNFGLEQKNSYCCCVLRPLRTALIVFVRCCRLLLSLPLSICLVLLLLLYLPLAHWYFYYTGEKIRQENASKSWLTCQNSASALSCHIWWTDAATRQAAFYLFKTLLVECFAVVVIFFVVVTPYLALSLFYLL